MRPHLRSDLKGEISDQHIIKDARIELLLGYNALAFDFGCCIRIANQIERCSGAKPVFYNEKIATLFSHGKAPDRFGLQEKLEHIRSTLDCEIGVSDTFKGFYDLKPYYDQAEWSLVLPKRNRRDQNAEIRYYNQFATYHAITAFCERADWKILVLPELLELEKNHDNAQQDLIKTLYAYLQRERVFWRPPSICIFTGIPCPTESTKLWICTALI